MNKPVAYVAGPMRNYAHFNFPAFHVAEKKLTAMGYEVLSPATHDLEQGFDTEAGLDEQDFDLGAAFVWDVASIAACDRVFLLEGWAGSTGARIEVDIAQMLGKPVALFDSFDVIPPPPVDEPITTEAHRLVYGDRGQDYGPPLEDFARTAAIWSAIIGAPVTAKQVSLCMVGVKISREVHRPKRENRVDLVGYALCADRVETGR